MKEFSPKTLQEAIQYFSDEQVCIETFARIRWKDGKPECPACGNREHYYLAKQRRFKCKECWKQFTVKMGTLLEDSPISLTKWLPALWMLVNDKNGISSYELGKALGITQKSAWFVLHRLRLALQEGSFMKFGSDGGPIEVDETFIGGKARNMHKERRIRMAAGHGMQGGHAKTVVIGMLQRGGKVKAQVIPDRKKPVVHAVISECIDKGANVITDEHSAYMGLSDEYIHEIINHAEAYVRDHVSTNGIENFWSLLKRGISGTYVSVEPFHLFRYIDEQAWRFNNRGGKRKEDRVTDAQRFERALSQVAGKRLTYHELTGKVWQSPF